MAYSIEVVQRDITMTDTETIVNAANNQFWMGSGVAGAIKRAGGDIIEKDAMAKGPVMPGEAVYTTAGRLPFKYVIHAAVMGQALRTSDKLIRQATVASLNIAEELKLKSIAFPAFGTGVGGFPMKACAFLMTSVVRGYRGRAKSLERVQFCLFDEYGLKLFSEAMAEE
ncbi:MAG: macro domain-containing protein [Candidatus Zixiibacteriota bacterium]